MLRYKLFSFLSLTTRNYSNAVTRLPRNNLLLKHAKGHEVCSSHMSAGDSRDVTYEEVRSLNGNCSVCLIDVREPTELKETGVIPGSINIPLSQLEDSLSSLTCEQFVDKFCRTKPDLDMPLVFSCKSGIRSEKALNIAQRLGYKRVHNYKGGWLDWERNIQKH